MLHSDALMRNDGGVNVIVGVIHHQFYLLERNWLRNPQDHGTLFELSSGVATMDMRILRVIL